MKAIWDPQARKAMRQIARYIQARFGAETRKAFIQKVQDAENLVKLNPNIGKIDPLFAGRSLTYRSVVVNGLSKMVYFVKGEIIYIAAFWDTRREPENQAKQVK